MKRFFELRDSLAEEVQERSTHKNPMYYHALKDLHWANVVCSLLQNQLPPQSDVDALLGIKQSREQASTTDLSSVLAKQVAPGVNVMTILDKYRDTVPDIHDQLKRVIEQQHLKVKGFYIVNQED